MKIHHFKELDSTNILAKSLIEKGEKPPFVVVAEKQTNGYGRNENVWFSPQGGLYFSLVLPEIKIFHLENLVLALGWSVAKTIKEAFGVEPFLKLPNDVYLRNKKIAGILVENVIAENKVKSSLAGIGLNTNTKEFPSNLKNKATSLKIELDKEVDNDKILKAILKNFKDSFLFGL